MRSRTVLRITFQPVPLGVPTDQLIIHRDIDWDFKHIPALQGPKQ